MFPNFPRSQEELKRVFKKWIRGFEYHLNKDLEQAPVTLTIWHPLMAHPAQPWPPRHILFPSTLFSFSSEERGIISIRRRRPREGEDEPAFSDQSSRL